MSIPSGIGTSTRSSSTTRGIHLDDRARQTPFRTLLLIEPKQRRHSLAQRMIYIDIITDPKQRARAPFRAEHPALPPRLSVVRGIIGQRETYRPIVGRSAYRHLRSIRGGTLLSARRRAEPRPAQPRPVEREAVTVRQWPPTIQTAKALRGQITVADAAIYLQVSSKKMGEWLRQGWITHPLTRASVEAVGHLIDSGDWPPKAPPGRES